MFQFFALLFLVSNAIGANDGLHHEGYALLTSLMAFTGAVIVLLDPGKPDNDRRRR